MPTLRSHTHLQAAQADTQTKAYKRVCLPNRTGTLQTQHDSTSTERRAACNTGLAIGGYDYKFEPIVISAPTHTKGIKSLFESNLKVYPNPASNQLQLEFINASDANAVIVINNATGQVIFSQSTNLKAGKITLDISTFAKGMYHLQVLGVEDKNLVATFIKQ